MIQILMFYMVIWSVSVWVSICARFDFYS